MAGYAVSNLLAGTQQAMTTSFKTLVNLSVSNATLLARLAVYEFVVGTDGTAADNAMVADVSRTTAIGTGTSATPTKLDPADGTSLGVGTVNHTSEPTVTAASSLWGMGFNQRATMRWVAFPGQELIIPATDANGLALRLRSPQGYTGTGVGQIEYRHN
ncbi:MAG: hypothetical protein Q8M26_08690 [Pseudolabrys sp.]|nr:hypothetical protein [Pseudolabrys sp.]